MRPISFLFSLLALAASIHGAPAMQPFFPIMAWSGVPDDPAALAKMHDCGFTAVGPSPLKYLGECQAAGMKLLIQDPRCSECDWQNIDAATAKKKIAALLAETGRHPATLGYYLMDEPHAAFFPGLAKVAAPIRELAPDKIPFINLLPNYATPDQLGAKTYDDYVESFARQCSPSIISYDHYALLDNGELRDGYYQNLEAVRKVAVKHDVPFWNVVLSVAHLDYRAPSQADFAFQAYTTLACGGRGLVYFMYFNPTVGDYRMAPIDQFGHETDTWPRLRYVNLQVRVLAPTILKLHSDDVYHVGEVPHGCHGPDKSSLIKSIAGGNFLVGDFTHEDGNRYVLIVNKDLKKSHPAEPLFTKPAKKVTVLSPYAAGQEDNFTGEQAWLAPGSGALLRVEFEK